MSFKQIGEYLYCTSDDIAVFPCAWRNEKYNIESRINTEFNFTHLSGVNSTMSYIAEPVEANSKSGDFSGIVFYLSGYRFAIKNLAGIRNPLYANIKFRDVSLKGNESTKVLANCYSESQVLDITEENIFGGICFTVNGPIQDVGFVSIQLTDESGNIYSNSYLPEIYHGSGKSAIQVCSGARAKGNNSLAIGKDSLIDSTGENSIVIGCKSKSNNKANVIVGSNVEAATDYQVIIGNGPASGDAYQPAEDIAIVSENNTVIGIKNEPSGTTATIKAQNIKFGPNADKFIVDSEGFLLNGDTKIKGKITAINNNTDYISTVFDSEVTTITLDAKINFNKAINIAAGAPVIIGSDSNEIKLDKTFTLKTTTTDSPIFEVDNTDIKVSVNNIDENNVKTALKISANNTENLIDAGGKLVVTKSTTNFDTDITFKASGTLNINNSTIKKAGTIIFGSEDLNTANMYINTDGGEIKATTFWATSDRRAKKNISEYKSQKSILDLPVYKYDYINGPKNQIGCMAQDLREICPEMVHEETNGMLSVDNSKVVYLLLNEVKKLRNELSELKAK